MKNDIITNHHYTLYSKNIPILHFKCERNANGEPYFIEEERLSHLLPIHFSDINTWVNNRRAPKHRKHIKEILQRCKCDDMEGYINFSYCAGLNDTYWVKNSESQITWEQLSLYKNTFDENIANLAFGLGIKEEIFSSASPELSTDGTFAKCWRRFRNDIYLLKQGSKGFSNAGREPYSEYFTSQLASNICDDSVKYELIKYHGETVSKCKLFCNENIGYAPIYSANSFDEIMDFYNEIGDLDKFKQMIVLDALTLNTDRHLRNFGYLYNNDSHEIIGMAPIFDNNLALCPYATNDELRNLASYMPTRTTAIGEGFNENAIKCLTPTIKDRLIAIKDFHFDNDYLESDERILLLENLIHTQVENLLQEKMIYIPNNIQLTDIRITTNKIPENWIPSNIYIKTNEDTIIIKVNDYEINKYDDELEIEIYNFDVNQPIKKQDIIEIRSASFFEEINTVELQLEYNHKINTLEFNNFTVLSQENVNQQEKTIISGDVIKPYVFFNDLKLKEVIIKEGIKAIEAGAFCGCTNIESIKLPETLLYIGENAFKGCSSLSKLDIPINVTYIDKNALKDTAIQKITISKNAYVHKSNLCKLEYYKNIEECQK